MLKLKIGRFFDQITVRLEMQQLCEPKPTVYIYIYIDFTWQHVDPEFKVSSLHAVHDYIRR